VSSKQKYNKVIYVARGNIIEKCGELNDVNSRQIKLSKGEIAGLQNLIPGNEIYDH
jgi:hypothetical protein